MACYMCICLWCNWCARIRLLLSLYCSYALQYCGKGEKEKREKNIYICEEDVVVDVELNEARNQEKKRETIAGQGPGVPLVLKNVL